MHAIITGMTLYIRSPWPTEDCFVSYFVLLLSTLLRAKPWAQAHNRSRGWALSAVANTAGPYKGGVWLLGGIAEAAFLSSASFVQTMVKTLAKVVADPTAVPSAAAAFAATGIAAQKKAAAVMSTAGKAKPGFVKVGPGPHLEYAADSSRYFMLGGDYFRGMHLGVM